MNSNPKELFRQITDSKRFNLLFKGLLIGLFLVLAVAFAVSITYSMVTEENFYRSKKANGVKQEYKKNFLVIMYQTSDDFLEKFKEGIFTEAEKKHILIDFVNVESIGEAIKNINIAVAAKVDGIIAQGIFDADYIDAINRAIEKGITVEFVYTDARGTDRAYFVGYNAYDLGKQSARCAIAEVVDQHGDIAVMVQSINDDEKDVTSSLFIEGFKSIADKYPRINLVDIVRTSYDLFSAEDMTYDILSRYPKVNTIVCTSEKDAFGAAQVIIDLNRVGNIKLIGVGVSEDIIKYIELKVIAASFDMNPGLMSVKSIEIMTDDKVSSDYIEVPIVMVDASNVFQYEK